MLDRYVSGKINRINREAPVSILLAGSVRSSTGGVGNAAKNAGALGAKTALVAVTGPDATASDLEAAGDREGYPSMLIEALTEIHQPNIGTET